MDPRQFIQKVILKHPDCFVLVADEIPGHDNTKLSLGKESGKLING